MRIVFMGSDRIACPALDAFMNSGEDICAIVSQPDRPKGRHRHLAPCEMKAFAEEQGWSVWTPEKIGSEEAVERLKALAPDLIVVVAYGQYIPQSVLTIPQHGAINLHPSLLPRYRGASPVQWALANGDEETGVTILYVGEKMDAGDIILQERMPIGSDDTAVTMVPKLAALGASMLLRVVDLVRQDAVEARVQDEDQALYVKKLAKNDGHIDWQMPARQINNRIRGFQPWPGCYCVLPGRKATRLQVWQAGVENASGEPGVILDVNGNGPLVATGEGALRLLEVQRAGKAEMSGTEFLRGARLVVGDHLL